MDKKEKEKIRRRKPECCWANWLIGFFIYAWTVVRAHPEKAFTLTQYMDLIYQSYVDFPGLAQFCCSPLMNHESGRTTILMVHPHLYSCSIWMLLYSISILLV